MTSGNVAYVIHRRVETSKSVGMKISTESSAELWWNEAYSQ